MAVNYQGGNEVLFGEAISSTLNTLSRIGATQQKQLAQQQEQRQKYVQKASEDIGKINASGIRDIDAPEIAKGYTQIKDLFYNLQGARNESERVERSIQLNQGITSLLGNIEKSKNWRNVQLKASESMRDTRYDPSKLESQVSKISSTPLSRLTDQDADISGALWGFDQSKALTALKDVDSALLNDFGKTNVSVQNIAGGKQATIQTVDIDKALNAYNTLYDTSRDFKGYVDNMATQGGLGVIETLGFLADQRAKQGFLQKSTIGNRPTPRVTNVYVNTAQQALPRAVNPSWSVGNYTGRDQLTLQESRKISGNLKLYSAEGGEEPADATTEYFVTGVMNVPTYKQSGKPIPEADVSRYNSNDVQYKPYLTVSTETNGVLDTYLTPANPSTIGYLQLSKEERAFYDVREASSNSRNNSVPSRNNSTNNNTTRRTIQGGNVR